MDTVANLRNTTTRAEDATAAGTAFRREQQHLGATCDFPECERHAQLGGRMCDYHELVRLSSNGSWVDDSHADGGHG